MPRLIRRLLCDHKGIIDTLTTLKDFFTMDILKEERKCLRCGKIVQRSKESLRKRKLIYKTIRNAIILGVIAVWIYILCFSL